jgi:hypothetical protein
MRLRERIRAALGVQTRAYNLALDEPILIRLSDRRDRRALEDLAALDGHELADGSFLLAELEGELVAAAPLCADAAPLKDPFRSTSNVRELLELQARHIRRHRRCLDGGAEAA